MKAESKSDLSARSPATPAPVIGFIGIGAMGAGMASNLLKHGFDVLFHARESQRGREAAARLLVTGARRAVDLADLGRQSEVVILCLPDSPAVESVLADEGGLTTNLRPGAVILDSSSSHPESTRRLARMLISREITLLDTPLTGSKAQADAGALSVLGAGDHAAFVRVGAVLRAFATKVFYLGDSGAGHAAKLMNNYLAQLALAGLCECWPLLEVYGLDRRVFFDAVSSSGGNSAVFQGVYPRYLKRDFTLNFAQRLACKDVRYLAEVAQAANLPAPLADALRAVHEKAVAEGFGDGDFTGLLGFYESLRPGTKAAGTDQNV